MKRLDFLKSLIVAPAVAKAVVSSTPAPPVIEPSPPMPEFTLEFREHTAEHIKTLLERARRTGIMFYDHSDKGIDVDPVKKMIEYARKRGFAIMNTEKIYLPPSNETI